MPTIAEEWIQEGFEKGMQQGMLQTARDNILDILEVRFETVSLPPEPKLYYDRRHPAIIMSFLAFFAS